jgi:hypothetical protein
MEWKFQVLFPFDNCTCNISFIGKFCENNCNSLYFYIDLNVKKIAGVFITLIGFRPDKFNFKRNEKNKFYYPFMLKSCNEEKN